MWFVVQIESNQSSSSTRDYSGQKLADKGCQLSPIELICQVLYCVSIGGIRRDAITRVRYVLSVDHAEGDLGDHVARWSSHKGGT